MRHLPSLALPLAIAAALTACAAPKLRGAVTPLEGGQYKSFVKGPDEPGAMKNFDADARQTCKEAKGSMNPFDKPKYLVVKQTTADKPAPEAKTDNQYVNMAVTLSPMGQALRNEGRFEVSTVFRCE